MRNKWTWIIIALILLAAGALLWWFEGPVNVSVVSPTRGPAVEAIYATGTVEPSVMMPISPRLPGTLIELNADEGSKVTKGQVLARMDDSDLASTVAEAAARARYAREQAQRSEELVRRGFLSGAERDRTRSDTDATAAALQRARTQRGFMSLTAPADGAIIRRDGEVGQFVPAGQAVFVLSCCAPLRVTAEVDEEDISRVRVGQKVLLRADAVPGETLNGEVSEITPKGDPISRSYRVRIRLAEPDKLKVGMTVDTNLIVAERQDALLLPVTAIQNGAVWLVVDGKLHRQVVRSGVTGAVRSEILEGIAADARVVDSPPVDLREGHAAHVIAPSATPAKQ